MPILIFSPVANFGQQSLLQFKKNHHVPNSLGNLMDIWALKHSIKFGFFLRKKTSHIFEDWLQKNVFHLKILGF